MITPNSIAKVIERLEALSKRRVCSDNPKFNAMDWSGGNFDDAYQYGVEDGDRYVTFQNLSLDKRPNSR